MYSDHNNKSTVFQMLVAARLTVVASFESFNLFCDSIAESMRFPAIVISSILLMVQPASDSQSLLENRVDTAKKAVGIVAGTVDATGAHIYTAGRTSLGGTQKPDGDTLFEIGSITKVFTSLLLADMIERGEVRADDPVSKYLPEHAEAPSRNGKQITLQNLSMQNWDCRAFRTT